MFRWIIEDTRALIADVRGFARRVSTRWQWFRMRSKRRWSEAAADLENVRRGAESRTRMCSSCRALIPVEARLCPECGEAPGKPPTRGMARIVEHMMPAAVSVSTIILSLNVAGYLLQHFVYQNLQGSLPPPARDAGWNIAMVALGASVPALVAEGDWWRLLTMVFLHGDMLHLVLNSWALLAVGPLVEEMYGSRKFIVLYLLTGLGGSLTSCVAHAGSGVPAIGASGAIFGLIGVAAVWGWRRGGTVGAGVRAQMVQWAVYGLLMGFVLRSFGVDNFAHVGGLVTGALLASVVRDDEPRSGLEARLWETAAWLCGVAIVGSFAMVSLRYGETLSWLIAMFSR